MSNGPTDVKLGLMQTAAQAVLARPFTELMAFVLAASIIAYAYYDLNIGRPQLVEQIQHIDEQSREEFYGMHKYTVDTFNNMMERQEQSHERIIQMLGGPTISGLPHKLPEAQRPKTGSQ